MSLKVEDISVQSVKRVYSGDYIGDDLIVFDDISQVPMPNGPRRMNGLLVALCLNGEIEYSIDTERHKVGSGDLLFISNGVITDDYHVSRDSSGIAVMLSDDFFHEAVSSVHELSTMFLFARTHPVYHLTDSETADCLEYFKMLKRKTASPTHFRKDVVRSLLTATIFDLSNIIYRAQTTNAPAKFKGTRGEAIFTEFITLLEDNYKHERRVSWYGQQMSITPKYLSETVKSVSHRTPNEWIDNYVLLEIRLLLKKTTKNIKEIAEEMNFPNQSFLGKYFKERMGLSPTEYRKN